MSLNIIEKIELSMLQRRIRRMERYQHKIKKYLKEDRGRAKKLLNDL